ncbi:DNA-processing protein DprA [Chitinophagaceae bacterium MMS25-I14]
MSFIQGIGPKLAVALLEHFGTPEEVIKAPVKELRLVPGMGDIKAKACKEPIVMQQAEEELAFVRKHNIDILFINDENYPQRLRGCNDAPVLLYRKGNANLDAGRIVSVIGTRRNTEYGQRMTEELIEGLRDVPDLLVVSGLAHGIDTIAHKASLAAGLPTVGVLGHGIDRIYPADNKQLANEMAAKGGILTEFPHGTKPDKTNFPVRNRIVAGLCDVTVVVESNRKGGAIITAYLASSYGREVAAFPGRVNDSRSEGCNELIQRNLASLITGAEDLQRLMNWGNIKPKKTIPQQLMFVLSGEEQSIMKMLQQKEAVHSDELLHHSGLSDSALAITLLQLEMQGLIKTLPGKMYRAIIS